MTPTLKLASSLFAVMALATGAAAQSTDQAADKVVLQLNWFHLADHSPYYLGLERGYYEEEGIDLEIIRGYGSSDTARKVELRQNTVGIAETGVLTTAIALGADIKIVGIIFDKPVNGIFSLTESGIETPQDLEGKSIAAPPGDGHLILWPAFCEVNQIDCSSIELINIQPEAKQAIVASGQAHGAFDAYTGLNIWTKALGEDAISYLDWSEWGIGLYGHGYAVHNELIEENPDLVERFLRASYKSWRDAKLDPEASIDAMIEGPDVQPFDREVYLENLHLILSRVVAERAAEYGIGWILPELMQSSIDLTALGGQMPEKPSLEDVFTNDFNPRIMPEN